MLCIISLFSLVFSGCRKNDIALNAEEQQPDKAQLDPQVQRVFDEFEERGSDFIQQFTDRYGQPLWSKSIVPLHGNAHASDTTVIVPVLKRGSEQVLAYLQANLSGEVALSVHTAKEYANLNFSRQAAQISDAEKHAVRFMLLNKKVFGSSAFRIKDARLFQVPADNDDTSRIEKTVFVNTGSANLTGRMAYVEICVTITITTTSYHCTHTGSCASGTCDGCSLCVSSSSSSNTYCDGWWEDDGGGGGGGGTGGGDTGGGGGGGGGTGGGGNPNPCDGSGPLPLARLMPCDGTDPGGGGGWDPVPDDDPLTIFYSGLSVSQQAYWSNPQNSTAVSQLFTYLFQNNYSALAQSKVSWGINYLIANPGVAVPQLINQFIQMPEGPDGDAFDQAFWDDPNLNIPPQSLPTYANMAANYPSHTDPNLDEPSEMFNSVGGMPLSIYNSNPAQNGNTCALRLSKALNYSGVTIPNIPGKTFRGADNKYYFLGAANMLAWMKKTFGTPTGGNHLTGAQGGTDGVNFPGLLAGKKGMYALIPTKPGGCSDGTGFCATGHVDIINNAACDGGCYFGATGGVKDIFIWELP